MEKRKGKTAQIHVIWRYCRSVGQWQVEPPFTQGLTDGTGRGFWKEEEGRLLDKIKDCAIASTNFILTF